MNSYLDVVAAYDGQADKLAERYEAISSEGMLAEVLPVIPHDSDRKLALDVGAGTGRDAAWLSSLGYEVVAAEPAAGMRRIAAEKHGSHGIRWVSDALPSLDHVHGLGLAYDLVLLSAVWQHVAPADRPRAFRKLATLMKPGGVLVITLRHGPAPSGMQMHTTSTAEIEGLARAHGLEVLRVATSSDQGGRPGVTWNVMALRMPDDGTCALPLLRGIVLSDEKSSTYKLALLRAVARIAEYAPAAATPTPDGRDAVEVPLGLVALNWLRIYLPLVRAGLPQMPGNVGTEKLGFAKDGFQALLALGTAPTELRVGATFTGEQAQAVASALSRAAYTIAKMPATFTRFPNSDTQVFGVSRGRRSAAMPTVLDLQTLRSWGLVEVPGHLWRAMSRYGSWIEPMLVAEWSRLTRVYGDRMGLAVASGVAEAALAWAEPVRTTALGRDVAQRLLARGRLVECVWTGKLLKPNSFDIDHCLPWSVWPCGDLWNLMPAHTRVNQHEKRDRLPSAAAMANARNRIIGWWEAAYLEDDALRPRFLREAAAALPLNEAVGTTAVYDALDWRRLRLSQDQQVPQWTPASAMT
ncbi:methyltransferase domain-containing protein [Sphingomonas sp. Tas61C01]|uniref:methyltransferase domain-containing protein n=1 Tax=Sphingomonas sp. Tas61C01 TaxID=3458297 RepID=UPI00403EA12F